MSYTLEIMKAPVWAELRGLPDATWIWLDMAGEGLHRAENLPEEIPPQLSHVWGWGLGWWVRARADFDLPGRVRAMILRSASPDEREPVAVETLPFRTWATKDNAVSAGGLVDELPRHMRQLLVRLPRPTQSGLWMQSVSFVDAMTPGEEP